MARNIVYLSGAYLPTTTADSVHVISQCAAYARRGWNVTLIARRAGNHTVGEIRKYYGVEEDFSITLLMRPQMRVIGAVINAISALAVARRAPRGTLIHAREVWALFLVAIFSDLEFIYDSHWRPAGIRWWVERWLITRRRCVGVVFISEALFAMYQSHDPKAMQSVRCCITHNSSDAVEGDLIKSTTRKTLRVGYIGSFVAGRGIELILEVARQCPEVVFLLVGGTIQEVRRYESMSVSMGAKNVELRVAVPRRELASVYDLCDVVVAPYQELTESIGWASPMKLFEYMAYGKAIVCSDFPVLREIIEQDVTGILVKPLDTEAWVHALRTLNDDRNMIERLGLAARARQQSLHTWDARTSRILSTLGISLS